MRETGSHSSGLRMLRWWFRISFIPSFYLLRKKDLFFFLCSSSSGQARTPQAYPPRPYYCGLDSSQTAYSVPVTTSSKQCFFPEDMDFSKTMLVDALSSHHNQVIETEFAQQPQQLAQTRRPFQQLAVGDQPGVLKLNAVPMHRYTSHQPPPVQELVPLMCGAPTETCTTPEKDGLFRNPPPPPPVKKYKQKPQPIVIPSVSHSLYFSLIEDWHQSVVGS